jgi:small ligand-binding sensory domain FIST
MRAAAAIAQGPAWQDALAQLARELERVTAGEDEIHLALLFASPQYQDGFASLVEEARKLTGARTLAGCSGQGIIGMDREIEGEPAISLMTLALPGADLRSFHLSQEDIERNHTAEDWHRSTGVAPTEVNAWLIFADPFSLDAEGLVAGISAAYPGTPLIGGLASGDQRVQRTHLFLDGQVLGQGAVALALCGPYTVRTVVSQGASPIGETWAITAAEGNVIRTIAGRPAYEVLVETVQALPPELSQRARSNLLVGLAMNEYREDFRRGDFLIRNLLGVDQASGALAVGATVQVGQTIQFQLRDPAAADEDLRELLGSATVEMAGQEPIAALLCSCNGRGVGLFGTPNHDAAAMSAELGPIPVSGFFCNGEIGPVGPQTFLHGFTASIAIIVPKEPS